MNYTTPAPRNAFKLAFSTILGTFVLALGGCSDDEEADPGSANPEPAVAEAELDRALADAPPRLAAVYERANEIVDGGVEAFETQLAELEGIPVVVNKWASWCGPCRFEFPFFQSQVARVGARVAFLGVDSDDDRDAAETFLTELPLPYPSFSDPDSEIADLLDAREFPSTTFYDSSGEIAYVRRGGYASEDELAADIDEWAR